MENIETLIKQYNIISSKIAKIAESKDTTADVLSKISRIEDCYIQTCIMTNPNTPNSILVKILDIHVGVGGVDEEIRIHIVANPALKIDVLKNVIASDPSERVKAAATAAFSRRTQGAKAEQASL